MKLVFVLWAVGVMAPTGHDRTPADWWHPTGIYATYDRCKAYADNHPYYARRIICLRMRYDRALVALSQKAQPR